jgi:hypothetical protein
MIEEDQVRVQHPVDDLVHPDQPFHRRPRPALLDRIELADPDLNDRLSRRRRAPPLRRLARRAANE